jgi:phospholipid/cholesterol/gamma-HCH transport system substrate-binding protein
MAAIPPAGIFMRNQSFFDIALGAAILVVAVGFLAYMRTQTGIGSLSSYALNAQMSRADSLKAGADVRISGVKVGTITGLSLQTANRPGGYRVDVSMNIRQGIPIPSDSTLRVSSGIMSSSYLDIRPGHSKSMLAPGATLHAS